jgi:hypothetical protein
MDNVVKEIEEASQRKKYLKVLVEKRCQNFDYLKRVYEENGLYWLNVVYAHPRQVIQDVDASSLRKRCKMWFTLGISLAPLVNISNNPTFVRSFAQMMEEFEYYVGCSLQVPVCLVTLNSSPT